MVAAVNDCGYWHRNINGQERTERPSPAREPQHHAGHDNVERREGDNAGDSKKRDHLDTLKSKPAHIRTVGGVRNQVDVFLRVGRDHSESGGADTWQQPPKTDCNDHAKDTDR